MKNRSWFIGIAMLVSLMLAALACGSGTTLTSAPSTSAPQTSSPSTAAPTSTVVGVAPTTQMTPSGTLDLVSSFGYKDASGYYHVVGLLHNGAAQALNNIELTLELKDASGKTLLRDSNGQSAPTVKFSPALDTLAPGGDSPFYYYVKTSDVGEPAQNVCKVTITGQQAA